MIEPPTAMMRQRAAWQRRRAVRRHDAVADRALRGNRTRRLKDCGSRRGTAAVEAAFCMPVLLILMLGMWEVGRMVQVEQILVNAAREGARVASQGTLNNQPVTASFVGQHVRDYLRAAGLPNAAASGANVQVVNQSAHNWTDPVDAQPLDKFQIVVQVPPGTAYNSLRWGLVSSLTGMNQISATANWVSLNDSQITVNPQLPF
jgi:Flp pilus assembly protein TadG